MYKIGDYWDGKIVVEESILFKEFVDVFEFNYHDLKVIPKGYGELKIEQKVYAKGS
jgi:hypothetical protein